MTDQSTIDAAFATLAAHRAALGPFDLRAAFEADPRRFEEFHVGHDDFLFDYSKNLVTEETMSLLVALAKAADVAAKRDAMFAGAPINATEKRAVLHTALRNFSGKPVMVDGHDVMPDIERERARCAAFADAVRDGTLRGATGKRIVHVVNVGIGGSDLGPAMAVRALSPFAPTGLSFHFIANVDGADMADCLARLDPAETLFIVCSKTFTTQETMKNAASARAWLVDALGEAAVKDHFAAVSTKLDLVGKFGIGADRTFGFWDWVGGRYSLWSSVGLSLMVAIGPKGFEQFLRGAFEADRHFCDASFERNIPVLMALLGIWNRNVLGHASQAVIPYDQRLSRFPAYLQQLDMESGGKSVRRDGSPVSRASGPVIWGEPGTNGQHAFFQLLHQGTEVVPVDFLLAARPTQADDGHHRLLVANCLAQGEALMRGRTLDEVRAILRAQGMADADIEALAPHKVFPGSRPSGTLLYERLDPRRLGFLVALYEHKVFVQAAIWRVNAYDQWGVELGKELASRLSPIVEGGDVPTGALDASTAGLVRHWKKLRAPPTA